MAFAISRKDIDRLKSVSYEEIRATLKSGDLIFASGDYLVSKAIQKVTHSPWSHVAIIIRVEEIDRILLLESVEDMGVRIVPLSKYLHTYENNRPYKGKIIVARLNVNQAINIAKLSSFGIDELTKPYDRDEISRILARVALDKGKKKVDGEYICSELVYECFLQTGIEFKYNHLGFISPQDIWLDSRIELFERIL
ncbi:YiiX/YebB-like N1pC/P60 family cysteine hydrolase [Acinetobacter sp. GSS19]|uniref:YiiX/YebB-like N1pC/P60 family cysteine hydrolase n=1 Tax=Acinetobacter sp. GSS19 TaxID=3020716 RepID=UPI002362E2B5|nr:YiiX/YebB-like N1pC/P60 family cysteine hydrolase [Acinetobacter sp. GSS19]